jgi:UDP-N-acetyl-2-amino-2-deoxyglucuronate dehydrogenase
MNGRQLSVLIVGFGAIGRRHALIASEQPGIGQVIVADPSEDACVQAEKLGFRSYKLLSEALATSPDICVIASPNGLHIEHGTSAFAAGCHVLVEKPLGLSSAEARAFFEVAQTGDRLLSVVMQNRLSPAAAWLKATLEAGSLGTPLLIEVSCLWNRDQRYYDGSSWRGDNQLDGGVLFTQFSHFIDLIIWLCGPIAITASKLHNYTHPTLSIPDTGTVHFELASGGLGTLNFTTSVWQQNATSALTIVGTRGTAKLGGQYFDRIDYAHIEGTAAPELKPLASSADGHRAVWAAFVDAVTNEPPYPSALTQTLSDAVEVIATIESIHALGTTRSGIQPETITSSSHG